MYNSEILSSNLNPYHDPFAHPVSCRNKDATYFPSFSPPPTTKFLLLLCYSIRSIVSTQTVTVMNQIATSAFIDTTHTYSYC